MPDGKNEPRRAVFDLLGRRAAQQAVGGVHFVQVPGRHGVGVFFFQLEHIQGQVGARAVHVIRTAPHAVAHQFASHAFVVERNQDARIAPQVHPEERGVYFIVGRFIRAIGEHIGLAVIGRGESQFSRQGRTGGHFVIFDPVADRPEGGNPRRKAQPFRRILANTVVPVAAHQAHRTRPGFFRHHHPILALPAQWIADRHLARGQAGLEHLQRGLRHPIGRG